MQIAVVTGNPEAQSDTRTVARALAASIIRPFDNVTVIDVDLMTVADRLFSEQDAEITELAAVVAASDLVLLATPTYMSAYTGLLKAFLDRYPADGLAGVITVPVMTGTSERHAVAVEFALRPVLVELGASVHTRGFHFVSDRMDRLEQIVAEWADEHAGGLRARLATRRAEAQVDDADPGPAAGVSGTESAFGTDQLRKVVGGFCSGITVITGLEDGRPVGMTCQSFISLSLDPPLIAFSPQLTSTSYPQLRQAGTVVVNILAEEQHPLGWQFARSGTDKFAGVDWEPAGNGAPLLTGTVAAIECAIVDEQVIGDHYLVVARVTNLHQTPQRRPLLFFRSQFTALGESL